MAQQDKIRVLIVDDSATMQHMLSQIFQTADDIEVVGIAHDPYDAREKIKQFNPDVLTLDVEMPRMDGLTFLYKIMTLRPMPVVMVSSKTVEGSEVTLKALELGAVDFVSKPGPDTASGLYSKADDILRKVRLASQIQVHPYKGRRQDIEDVPSAVPEPQNPSDVLTFENKDKVIAIGASTGGVVAIKEILLAFSQDAPPILIAQHMPKDFTDRFAKRLNRACAITVIEAEQGQRVKAGHAYVAPGGKQLRLSLKNGHYICDVFDDENGKQGTEGHKPSVDVLFDSVAKVAGRNSVGVILTGMGRDGAQGLLQMRKAGARTIGQDHPSSVVYGMPKAAMEIGAVEGEVTLSQIPTMIVNACRGD